MRWPLVFGVTLSAKPPFSRSDLPVTLP
jgi:hypothetical protein